MKQFERHHDQSDSQSDSLAINPVNLVHHMSSTNQATNQVRVVFELPSVSEERILKN